MSVHRAFDVIIDSRSWGGWAHLGVQL